jgi:hypothetical protein
MRQFTTMPPTLLALTDEGNCFLVDVAQYD